MTKKSALPTLQIRLLQRPKHPGAPTLLFLSSAALRVADATRILKQHVQTSDKEKSKAGEVAKLFGKHFKLEEHANYLRRTKIAAGVGTPGRVGKLLCDTDSLSLTALTHIILDTTYQDAKKRTIFDIPETRSEIFKLIFGNDGMRKALKSGKIELVFF